MCVGSASDRRVGVCSSWVGHPREMSRAGLGRPPRFGPVEGSGESEGFGVGFGEREPRELLLWDGRVVKGKDEDAG